MNLLKNTLLLLLTTALPAQQGPDSMPMTKGNRWTYRCNFANQLETKIDRYEEVEGTQCAVMQTLMDGKVVNEEWLAIGDGALRSYQMRNQQGTITFGKPVTYLRFPIQDGDRWTTSSRDFDAKEIRGEYSVATPVTLNLSGKKLECAKITANLTGGQGPIAIQTWIQPGVGMVKQVIEQGGQEMVAELTGAELTKSPEPRRERRPEPEKPTAALLCEKCNQPITAGNKFCGECGAPVRKKQPSAPEQPGAKSNLERYESEDGKVVLFRPHGWDVKVGDLFGEGNYAVTITNPGDTAGVLMIAAPLENATQPIPDSVAFANLVLKGLGDKVQDFKVDKMTSSQDRARTCTEVRYVDEGKPRRAHFYFFWTRRVATFLGFGSIDSEFEAMRPLLTTLAANLAYAPEGARKVLDQGRERAERNHQARPEGQPIELSSPVRMLQAAKTQPVPEGVLERATAPDGSFAIGMPRGWQIKSAGGGQYAVASDAQGTEGVFYAAHTLAVPDRSGLGMDQFSQGMGYIIAPVMPPAQALALILEKKQAGSQMRVLSGNSIADLDPKLAQQTQQLAMQNGTHVEAQLLLVEFTHATTGKRVQGIVYVCVSAPSMGQIWTTIIAGYYAPVDIFTKKLPLYLAISDSYSINQTWATQTQQQKNAQLAQSQSDMRRSINDLSAQYDRNNASWWQNQKSNDYLSWARSQTTLGQGTWVAQREGGEVVNTHSWGAQDEQGRQAEGQPWNTTNFRGHSPWTGEQLQEVNTRADYERFVQGR